MRIRIKTFGNMKKREEKAVSEMEFPELATVYDIMRACGIDAGDVMIVLVNSRFCDLDYVVNDGDEVIFIPYIGAG